MIQCNDKQEGPVPRMSPEVDTRPLREAILTQTTQIIHRRRWVRRGAIASALIVCYVAGLGTMRAWVQVSSATQPVPVVAVSEEPDEITPQVVTKAAKAKMPYRQVVLKQTRPRKSRFEIICEISDRYLYRDADTEAAIRGYRRALRIATPQELTICPERDSWLLMALKQELKGRENRNENRGV